MPAEVLIWQDPVPAVDHALIDGADADKLKADIMATGCSVAELAAVAWASASTFRGSDKRGGANGARICLAPQKYWESNNPVQLDKVLDALSGVRDGFNALHTEEAGVHGRHDRARWLCCCGSGCTSGGSHVSVPFAPGRTDATAEMTDVESFRSFGATGRWFPQLFQRLTGQRHSGRNPR